MNAIFTTQNILFGITLMGIAFTIYRTFQEPDAKADKEIALLSFRLGSIEKQMSNDLPHIDSQIKDISNNLAVVNEKVVALTVIIDERIPKRV